MIVHVAVFSARGERISVRAEIYAMHGTEMSVDIGQLIAVNKREHLHFESTGICARLRNIFGILAPSSEDVELLVSGVIKKRRQNG